jgi:O-succinylbenzoic acid--CoA ligase
MGDIIVTGGEKVWPDPVERLLRRLPSVADVAVAGRPDPEWGQRVVAWVVADGDPPSLEEVRDAVKVELPAYAAPKQLVLVRVLPRTALGKVRRAELP